MPHTTPAHATIFDCEYLTVPGAMNRHWAGPEDPDPLVVQIGAVRLTLSPPFQITEKTSLLIQPVDRSGVEAIVDPFFTELTGISQQQIDAGGLPLADAMKQFERFAQGGPIWSWGKDELHLFAISCYIAGCAPPLPATRFGNARALLVKAGVPMEDVDRLNSGALASHFGITHTALKHHDAADDAHSIALSLQHLLRIKALSPSELSRI